MYGGDIERILLQLNNIKDETAKQIEELAKVSDYQLVMKPHEHSVVDHSLAVEVIVKEEEHPISPTTYTEPIISLSKELGKDEIKMKTIEKMNFTAPKNFNNNYGSPWSELYTLQEKIKSMHEYASSIGSAPWLGQKHSLLHMMQIVLNMVIDNKYALTIYQDYIQRGYDKEFNNNISSVPRKTMNGETIGNRTQDYDENVNVRKESNDPF